MKLTVEQFAEHFNDRLRMLMRSCDAYDSGDYAEATRLAGSIVKLIGDRRKKTGEINRNFISLASRLGIKPQQIVDSSLREAMEHQHLHGPLCTMGFHLAGASGLVPLLDGFERQVIDPARTAPFDDWWTATVIRDCYGNEFSRRAIVETMRDQEDAHTDGDLNPEYAAIAYAGSIGIRQVGNQSIQLDENPARVVVRQIAHEVLKTFVPGLPVRFIQTHGLLVQPLMLYEVMEKTDTGELAQVLDHKAIEFRAESTSTPEVWEAWEKFIRVGPNPEPGPPTTSDASVRNFAIRIALLNYAPYPIEGVRAMVSMQHPAG